MKSKRLILLAATMLFWILISGCAVREPSVLPKVKEGVMDLREWSFDSDGIVKLDGEWMFYWNKLISHEQALSDINDIHYFYLPLYWHKYEKDSLSRFGYATYTMSVLTDETDKILALNIPNITAAYKLWVNGKLVAERGVLEANSYWMPFISPVISESFKADKGKLDLVLQVSNYIDPESGVAHSIELAGVNQIFENRIYKIINEAGIFGICFIMAFYHFILYVFRKKNKEVLYFGLFCISIGIRLASQGENIREYLYPDLPYYFGSAILYGTAPLAAFCYTCFKAQLFSKYVSKKIIKGFLVVNAVYFIMTLVTPMVFYGTVFYIYLYFLIVNAVYVMIYIVLKAVLNREKEALIVLLGSVVLFATIINDIMYFNQANNSGYIVSFGLFVFIFFQSLVIARRFSHAFKSVEDLSERLIVMDKVKDEFLANTSHELRTPVNGIIGISESLIDGATGELSEETKENLGLISSSGRRLASLINDILDFSRLKNKDIVLQKRSIDISQTVNVVITVIKSTFAESKVSLINDIPQDTKYVFGDENRVQQIMYNLVGNAVKFTKEGYIRVAAKEVNGFIQVCVEDTGIGVPKDKFEAIFKSFEQVDASISREFGGTGLGLSITKQLVELHGGNVWLESELGRGTKVYFTLPVNISRDEAPPVNEAVSSTNTISDKYANIDIRHTDDLDMENDLNENEFSFRILIVDDEKINIKVLTNYLSMQKYQLDVAENGLEALNKIEHNKYDLILLDIMMPKMSGYEVCKKLREKHSLYDLPVILLTAKNQVKDMVAGFNVGANDYLIKPFEKNELTARVKTLVSLKQAVNSAIENAKLFGEAKKLADVDPLTDINNRRRMFELARQEYDFAVSNNGDMSVLMLDIDYFKNINDTYGHDVGDIIIKNVANIIYRSLRVSDIVGRYGGEEFAVILPGTALPTALIVADKIRRAIEASAYTIKDIKPLSCTVSIGVAGYSKNISDIEQLFKIADSMLYKAKHSGRNRVEG